jgi:hypothetical protein
VTVPAFSDLIHMIVGALKDQIQHDGWNASTSSDVDRQGASSLIEKMENKSSACSAKPVALESGWIGSSGFEQD